MNVSCATSCQQRFGLFKDSRMCQKLFCFENWQKNDDPKSNDMKKTSYNKKILIVDCLLTKFCWRHSCHPCEADPTWTHCRDEKGMVGKGKGRESHNWGEFIAEWESYWEKCFQHWERYSELWRPTARPVSIHVIRATPACMQYLSASVLQMQCHICVAFCFEAASPNLR